MKSFFENLFGGKRPLGNVQKPPAPAALHQSKPAAFDQYKKGDVIGGKYEVHGTLGIGGFGVVLLATERDTNELRALKTFRDEFLADPASRDAFKKEALLWVNLEEHPFILAARWVETFSGRLFVAMDYIAPDAEGRVNLADHLRPGKPIRPERAAEWAIQFCMGMEHANAHGIRCHRDIKPANMLIAQDGRLKIADFGLAAVADVRPEMTDRERIWTEACENAGMPLVFLRSAEEGRAFVAQNQDGSFGFSMMQSEGKLLCGTPGYIAPEVYRGETADVPSDIYTFGLVLWQMATGSASPPFISPVRKDIEVFLRETYEQQMSGRVPSVTSPLGAVVKRCLNPTPSQRYSNFSELRCALEPIFQRLTGSRITIPTSGEHSVAFWCNKGGSLVALGRYVEAIACFDKALRIDPRDAMSWCNKGATLFGLERWDEAIACLNKTLSIDPQHALAWSNKGGALKAMGRHEDALACYDKALAIEPSMLTAWSNKGSIFNALGLHEKAITCFDSMLAIDPRDSAAWNNKGRTLGILCRHEEAIVCFDKAIVTHPSDAMAFNNKGASLNVLGRRKEAIACYERALAIDPRHAMAWLNKAGTENAIGRTPDAIKSYSKFLDFAPPDAEQVARVRRILKDLQSR